MRGFGDDSTTASDDGSLVLPDLPITASAPSSSNSSTAQIIMWVALAGILFMIIREEM